VLHVEPRRVSRGNLTQSFLEKYPFQ